MVQVTFAYDEESRLWEPTVTGVEGPVEARQAFNAVVLTLQELNPRLLNKSLVAQDGELFKITPAV